MQAADTEGRRAGTAALRRLGDLQLRRRWGLQAWPAVRSTAASVHSQSEQTETDTEGHNGSLQPFKLSTHIYSSSHHFHVKATCLSLVPICEGVSAHLEHEHHARHHGVHVVLAQLLAEGRAQGSQRLQILLQDFFAHVGQHLRGVPLQIKLHPVAMGLFSHTVQLKAGLWRERDRQTKAAAWKSAACKATVQPELLWIPIKGTFKSCQTGPPWIFWRSITSILSSLMPRLGRFKLDYENKILPFFTFQRKTERYLWH